VEAQAIGTMSVAFDTGAHPEVCPLVFPDLVETAQFLSEIGKNRSLLLRHSRAAYHFVRRSFRWQRTATRFRQEVLGDTVVRTSEGPPGVGSRGSARSRTTLSRQLWATWRSLRLYGLPLTLRKIHRRIGRAIRIGRP